MLRIAEMQADVRVTGMLGSGVRSWPRAMAEAGEWIATGSSQAGGLAMLAIASRVGAGQADDQFLGMGFLGSIGPIGGCDAYQLGYRLHHSAWGQGYATEAAGALQAHGLGACSLKRLFAFTRQDNIASARVLTKIGMTEVGIRVVGGYHARLFYSEAP
jgi:RimJ/RimL family protein N-acetyltransferase